MHGDVMDDGDYFAIGDNAIGNHNGGEDEIKQLHYLQGQKIGFKVIIPAGPKIPSEMEVAPPHNSLNS